MECEERDRHAIENRIREAHLPRVKTPTTWTGNLRDFPKFWKQTTVVSPREFIGIVAPHLTAG